MRIRTLAITAMLLAATAVQAQNFELHYQSDSGALDLVKVGATNATTVEIKSESGQLTGDRPAHFNGLFDVYTANKAFKLDPAGFGSIAGFAFIAPGATSTDIIVDGSLVGGGPIGDVAIASCCVHPDPVETNVTYDPATGNLDFNAGGKAVTTLELKSRSGLLTGDRPAHFSGLFDVYEADKAFKLDPAGFGDIPAFAMLGTGLTNTALVADFEIDGSLAGGGPLGDVAIIGGADGTPSFCVTSAGQVCVDFDNNPLPAGAMLFGAGEVRDMGGNGGGYLKVTDAANGERATVVFPDLTGNGVGQLVFAGRTGGANAAHHIDNIEVTEGEGGAFSISASLRVGGGTDSPADGFSFSFVRPGDPVLDDGEGFAGIAGEDNLPEEGTTTGVSIGFDEWQSGPAPGNFLVDDVVGMSLRVDGELVGQANLPTLNGVLDDTTSLQTGPNDNGLDGLGWATLTIDYAPGSNPVVTWKGSEVEFVPEPGSFTLIGIGALALGLVRRRRS